MTPERYQQVKVLFQSALECEPDERAAFLANACAGDDHLLKEVESLISSHEAASTFIDTPVVGGLSSLLADAETVTGQRIGHYKVVRELGHGGMGTVYLAARDDKQYHKQVAIKLIKRGMDTREILRRFRYERQILASLDHPNISRLLDGGTTEDGLPYVVMEYIEGQPIDKYCDAHKLSISERLELFRTVCAAISYAHQNLVVHRDIKPGNILVTAEGAPKLLDFGIAKLLNPGLFSSTIEPTATVLRLMTPDYASPEQVRGEPITTASDVYSLGVLLYELLTGHRPYRLKSHLSHEILQTVCEKEPAKPSTVITREEVVTDSAGTAQFTITPDSVSKTREGHPEQLRRRLAGDLDNIVLMAMRKEPQRRYASVGQLSEDIHRHLQGLPVIARNNTFGYRGAKFIKRNKAGVAAAALIVLTLAAGVVATAWQASVAMAQRAKAEQRFNDLRKLANSFMFEIHDQIENLPGSTPARSLLVKRALEYLDRLAHEAQDDMSLQSELATAYEKVGDIQGNPESANLGDTAGALESYHKALVIRQAVMATDPKNAQNRLDLASCYDRIGHMQEWGGDMTGALESHRQALASCEELLSAEPANAQARRDSARSHQQIGNVLAKTGDTAGALENHRRARAIYEALSTGDPTNLRLRRSLAVSLKKIGDMLWETDDLSGTLETYRAAQPIFEALLAADPTNALARRDVSMLYSDISDTLEAKGDLQGALENARKSLAISEMLSAVDTANVQARRDLAISYGKIGQMLAKAGDETNSLENLRRGLAIFDALAQADKASAQVHRDLAICFDTIGDAHSTLALAAKTSVVKRAEHWRDAGAWYQRSLDVYRDMRDRGTLRSADAGSLDEITDKLSKSREALAKLRGAAAFNSTSIK